jgi:NAD(P)-dependent dehydrogenase (short-subunit alcohol dehydrogenase family)
MGAMKRGVAVVTGGSRGIGAVVAARCAAAGWRVCFSYVADAEAAERVDGVAVRADVAVEADVVRLFDTAAALGPITAVVVNAGIVGPRARISELSFERVSRMFAVNAVGAVMCCREAARRMDSGGSIVLLSSMAAKLGSPGEYVDYAASKGAVDTLGIGLSRELAQDGIRVNVVRPGIIDTDIHASGGQPDRAARLGPGAPLGRAGTADEVAAAVLWLLSDEASYCTGAILDESGGR